MLGHARPSAESRIRASGRPVDLRTRARKRSRSRWAAGLRFAAFDSLFNSLAAAFLDFVFGHRCVLQRESHAGRKAAGLDILPDKVALARVRIELVLPRPVVR